MKNWAEVLEKFLGPGFHPGEESDMNDHVFSAGESLNVFTRHNDANAQLVFDKSNPLWVKLNQDRSRVTVEICCCSTLGGMLDFRNGGSTPSKTTRGCSVASGIIFQL